MTAMTCFLSAPGYEFSGICNFNYKERADGSMCIFEINTRVGAGWPKMPLSPVPPPHSYVIRCRFCMRHPPATSTSNA